MNNALILIGKLISFVSKTLKRGNGSTWPGHIALSANQNFIQDLFKKNSDVKIILIAGTNGKTTTTTLLKTIIEHNGNVVIQNSSGANLLNGIASALILSSSLSGALRADYALFEVDENTLPHILTQIKPAMIIFLNLFRDQLDRYGEVNTIATKWKKSLSHLNGDTTLIVNANDPLIASIGLEFQTKHPESVYYFGLSGNTFHQEKIQHASDSSYCPCCGTQLTYSYRYYSHIGEWECTHCGVKNPQLTLHHASYYPLSGVYNRYNTLAAVLTATLVGINTKTIDASLHAFHPAFGRQEVIETQGKKIQFFLSKNPTSFNESLRTICDLQAKHILVLLNDRIPDGRDISWIWDIDTEKLLNKNVSVVISGDRAYDMGLRLKYASPSELLISQSEFLLKPSQFKFHIEENLEFAIKIALDATPNSETLYILPTYSALLDARKCITGKKIL